jgi:hypothetical protein
MLFLAGNALDGVYAHETGDAVQATLFAFFTQILPDTTRTQNAITLRMKYTDTIQQTLVLSCPDAERTTPPAVIAAC